MGDTRINATNYVITALENDISFPVDQIVDALYELADGWDFDAIDETQFWATVAAVTCKS